MVYSCEKRTEAGFQLLSSKVLAYRLMLTMRVMILVGSILSIDVAKQKSLKACVGTETEIFNECQSTEIEILTYITLGLLRF